MNNLIEKKHYVHFHGATIKGHILMVVSSPTISRQTGWPIGFWASELTHPLKVFLERGYHVETVSTVGGKVEMDGYSNPMDASGYSADDVISLGFLKTDDFNLRLKNTKSIEEIDASNYDAIFLVGGQGPMYTFRHNETLQRLFVSFYEDKKPAAAVCHATAMLLDTKLTDGDLLVKHKTWTGFANSEEDFANQAVGMIIQPFRIEDEARKLNNTSFKVDDPFSSYVIVDGNLITGQQQNSGEAAAIEVVNLLNQ